MNIDYGKGEKDSWLVVLFSSETNNRDIAGKNTKQIWFQSTLDHSPDSENKPILLHG